MYVLTAYKVNGMYVCILTAYKVSSTYSHHRVSSSCNSRQLYANISSIEVQVLVYTCLMVVSEHALPPYQELTRPLTTLLALEVR